MKPPVSTMDLTNNPRKFRLGQPVVVVAWVFSCGWSSLNSRSNGYTTDVEILPNTTGMVVEVSEDHLRGRATLYKILWSNEKMSWHHSSLILALTPEQAEAGTWDKNL